jgi:uncharacterized protein YjbI with pentapeptide repeats
MKVLKPSKLSVLTRCFEHEQRFYMGVSVLAFVPLAAEPGLLPEAAMWAFAGKRLGKDGALDAGIPKARGEYLIHGSAYAPGGAPATHVPVGARVGQITKRLSVTGDRYWLSGHSSAAQPFTQMPLTWAQAYGGPEFLRNPVGKGHGLSEFHGQQVQLLPNVERAEALVNSPNDRPEPGGFGPIDVSWPQRASLAGTYDQHWLDNLFPGLARDVDWGMFSLAAADQQNEGHWQGGETYEFMNLHPTQPRLVGQLPQWIARAFVTRTIGKGDAKRERFDEVPLRMQTLWFFPDAERAVLIFHGSLPVTTDDGADIVHLLLGADAAATPRPASHYAEVLATRLDPEVGGFAALDDSPLLPEGLADVRDPALSQAEALHTREGLIEANLHNKRTKEFEKARAFVALQGLDPDIHGPIAPEPPQPPPTPAQVPALIKKLVADAKLQEKELLAEQKERQAQVEKELDAMGVEGLDSAALREEQSGPVGPPTYSAAGQRAALEAVALECRALGWINDEVELMLADRELEERWKLGEVQLRDVYRMSAHLQPPAPAMAAADLDDARVCLHKYVEAGRSVSELNLTGADFRGMDLRGADLSDTWFESACFDGADLSGAKLDKTVFAHGSFIGAKLDGASAREANFGKANFMDASAIGVDFESAVLNTTRFERTILRAAKLTKADVHLAEFVATDASEITAQELVLNEAKVTGSSFARASLERSLFVKLDLDGVDLSGARLERCAFVSCTARRANFTGATLTGVAFVEACVLDDASFVQAHMPTCNLRGVPVARADFTAAHLDGADFSGGVLTKAKFYRASAREARFDKADLSEVSMLAANLMGASFMNATIEGADFRGANLHGADMARVHTDDRVRLDDALLTKVRVLPKHHEQPEP